MSGSLTIALAMILMGVALIYSGWTNNSLKSLFTGKRTQRAAWQPGGGA